MTPYYQKNGIILYHGDCREVLAGLEAVDLLLTDPPYGLDGAIVRGGNNLADWSDAGHNVLVQGWRALVRLSANAYAVEFGADARNAFLHAAHTEAGWTPWTPFAMVRAVPAPTPRPCFASGMELALVSRVGKPKWQGGGYLPNRWIGQTPNQLGQSHGHPTEKPLEVMALLVRGLTVPGALVLDPFAGSGTTLRACKDLHRRCIGVEMNERYCEIAARRLDQNVLPLTTLTPDTAGPGLFDGAGRPGKTI